MKRTFDLCAASLLIILMMPLLVIISLLVLLTSPGPVLFLQRRIGLNGRVFLIFKFRTMRVNAEHMGTGLHSFEHDPRITFIGKYLRQYSLDELPQLFNVLLGSMSLVGPRPPVTYELGPWETFSNRLRRRFCVKPGITGLAQVSGRNDLNWEDKLAYDIRYIDSLARYGPKVDIPILLKTIKIVIQARNVIETESMQMTQTALGPKVPYYGKDKMSHD